MGASVGNSAAARNHPMTAHDPLRIDPNIATTPANSIKELGLLDTFCRLVRPQGAENPMLD